MSKQKAISNKNRPSLETPPTEYTVRQRAEEEGWKLHHDTSKHITTLSTGSILILIAFLEKMFPQPRLKGLIILALAFFVVSIVASVMAMACIASYVRDQESVGRFSEKTGFFLTKVFYVSGFTGFVAGIATLIFFALENLYG